MKRKSLVKIISLWITLQVISYYYQTVISVLIFAILNLLLIIIPIIKLIKLAKSEYTIEKYRVLNAGAIIIIVIILLDLTGVFKVYVIEKIDWHLLYKRRMTIVEQVKKHEINPDTTKSIFKNYYKLPYSFPIVSNSGNVIYIYQHEENNSVTIEFPIYPEQLVEGETMLIYSNNKSWIEDYELRIKEHPLENSKIKNNWYRIHYNH